MSIHAWIGGVKGCTVSTSEAEYLAVLGRNLASTAEAASLGAVGDTDLTATASEISNICDGSNSYVALTTGSSTISSSNTGKKHLVAAISSNIDIILPAEAAGLNYKVIYISGADETENITIGTEAAANYFIGNVKWHDIGASAAAVATDAVYSDGNSNSLFTMTNPCGGSYVELLCDGTHWYIWGDVVADTAPAFADT